MSRQPRRTSYEGKTGAELLAIAIKPLETQAPVVDEAPDKLKRQATSQVVRSLSPRYERPESRLHPARAVRPSDREYLKALKRTKPPKKENHANLQPETAAEKQKGSQNSPPVVHMQAANAMQLAREMVTSRAETRQSIVTSLKAMQPPHSDAHDDVDLILPTPLKQPAGGRSDPRSQAQSSAQWRALDTVHRLLASRASCTNETPPLLELLALAHGGSDGRMSPHGKSVCSGDP